MYLLLVEDDPAVTRVVTRALTDEGHRVETVAHGDEALVRGATGAYDLILLDVLLPGMDGLSVCQALRHQQVHTPILMVTARDAIPDRVRGLDVGADDYLVKPFSLMELLARVRALLRRSGNGEGDVLKVGDLTLDLNSRSVTRAGQPIDLTRREFEVLAYLMRHPNQVLTKSQLIDHVWGYTSDVTANAVEMYIHYLREKLDRGFPRPLIRTIRGAGYLIRE
jgi:DNA-binding response OmpR family regulator